MNEPLNGYCYAHILYHKFRNPFTSILAHSCAIFQSQPLSLWAFLSPPITLFAVLAVIRQAVDNFALEKTFNKILSLLGLFKNQWGEFLKKLDLPGKRVEDIQKEYELLTTTRRQQPERPLNEAPRSKLRGIKAEFAEANPPSLFKLRRVRPAIHPCSKLQGILAKANKIDDLRSQKGLPVGAYEDE